MRVLFNHSSYSNLFIKIGVRLREVHKTNTWRHVFKRDRTTSSNRYSTLNIEHNWEDPCTRLKNPHTHTSDNHNRIKGDSIFNAFFFLHFGWCLLMQNRRFVAWISSVEVKRTWKTHRIAPTLLIRKHSIRFTLSEFQFEWRPLPCLFDLEIEADRSIEQFAKVHLIQVLLVYCWCGYRNFCLVPFFWANLFFLFQGMVYVSSVLKSFVPQSDSQYGVYILAQKLALHSSPTHSIHRNADLLTFHTFLRNLLK